MYACVHVCMCVCVCVRVCVYVGVCLATFVLFFDAGSSDGKMWAQSTPLMSRPQGWTRPPSRESGTRNSRRGPASIVSCRRAGVSGREFCLLDMCQLQNLFDRPYSTSYIVFIYVFMVFVHAWACIHVCTLTFMQTDVHTCRYMIFNSCMLLAYILTHFQIIQLQIMQLCPYIANHTNTHQCM